MAEEAFRLGAKADKGINIRKIICMSDKFFFSSFF